jgi:hypothetical protein
MLPADRGTQFFRMQEARRQTQHQLDLIERQITRRMTALIPQLGRKQPGYRRGKPPNPITSSNGIVLVCPPSPLSATRKSTPCRANWHGRMPQSRYCESGFH